jgi:hypothetical protein
VTDRSSRGQLQAVIGELGAVHRYRWTPEGSHRFTGWWMTPAAPVDGCGCDACIIGRTGRDVYLGSVTRTALYDAGRIALEHQPAVIA